MKRPGDRLRAFAATWSDARTMTLVVDPLIADLRMEHAKALQDGRVWRSRLVRVHAAFAFLRVMVAMDWTSNERGLLARTAGHSLAAIVCVTTLFAVPVFLMTPRPQAYLVYAIPQLLAIAIPIGIAIGIVAVLGGIAPSRRLRAGVLALALAGVVASFVTAGWIGPVASRAARFANGVADGDLNDLDARSPTELTLGQLNDRIHKAADFGLSRDVGYLRWLLEIYYGRWAFAAANLTLTFGLLAVMGFRQAGRKTLGGTALVLVIGYEAMSVVATRLGQHATISAILAAWLPNLVLALVAATLTLVSWRWPSRGAGPGVSA